MNKRSNIFDDAAELDLGAFKPVKVNAAPEPDRETLRRVSEASNFPSRQAPRAAPAVVQGRAQRRHRTGRNQQINIKATGETITAFNHICDEQNWVGGETLERALAALRRELANR